MSSKILFMRRLCVRVVDNSECGRIFDGILTVVMCGVSAGENTVRRTLGMIDPKIFQRLFIKWIEEKIELGIVLGQKEICKKFTKKKCS